MTSSIRITGWAPKGEPMPKGAGSAECFLQLSESPDLHWRRIFKKQAEPLAGIHRHEVIYELVEDRLRVWCPIHGLSATVEGAKRLVSSTNLEAVEFHRQQGQLRVQEAESRQVDRSGIVSEMNKIRFD